MNRRGFVAFGLTLASARRVRAQTGKPARIGWLTAQRAPSLASSIGAFRTAMSSLGYVEGRNLEIEFRYGDDSIDRIPELAAELVALHVDLIVVQGTAVPVVNGLKLQVPVVFVFSGDPVSADLAPSLNHPRPTMTGLTFMAAELNGKRIELLREILPHLQTVALVANPEHPGVELERSYGEQASRQLGVATAFYATRNRQELADAFRAMAARPPQALSVFSDGFAVENRQRIIDFANGLRAPVISGWSVFAESGAVCTYGPRLAESYRRLAYFVDRVLKGAKPSELPIERPTVFELVINLRAAKALGLTLAPDLVARADTVIE